MLTCQLWIWAFRDFLPSLPLPSSPPLPSFSPSLTHSLSPGPPVGFGAQPNRQTIWCISEPKGAAQVATVFVQFLYVTDKHNTKYNTVHSLVNSHRPISMPGGQFSHFRDKMSLAWDMGQRGSIPGQSRPFRDSWQASSNGLWYKTLNLLESCWCNREHNCLMSKIAFWSKIYTYSKVVVLKFVNFLAKVRTII